MFSEAKVTEIYCLANNFCKKNESHQENFILKDTKKDASILKTKHFAEAIQTSRKVIKYIILIEN